MNEPEYSISLKYGPREDQAIKEMKRLNERRGIFIDSEELMKRSILISRNISEIDTELLTDFFLEYLRKTIENNDARIIGLARSLSLAIYASLISRYGILESSPFEIIPVTLKSILELKEATKDENSRGHLLRALERATELTKAIFSEYKLDRQALKTSAGEIPTQVEHAIIEMHVNDNRSVYTLKVPDLAEEPSTIEESITKPSKIAENTSQNLKFIRKVNTLK
jgi:hypothetical protein